MQATNNFILTIAGHDPSGGAGITSDIKTFEAHGLYGLSVCTAITVQNDIDFKQCIWVDQEVIIDQIETLFERFQINVVKIGILKSWEQIVIVTQRLHSLNPAVKIILDPVIKASAGFDFHSTEDQEILDRIWGNCFIVTPNYDEIKQLYPSMQVDQTIQHLNTFTHIYLKGGHRTDKKGWDSLYNLKTGSTEIPPGAPHIFEKHGSGCVLSSALASQIAIGATLLEASRKAKSYTENFLNSNDSLLGTHNYKKVGS